MKKIDNNIQNTDASNQVNSDNNKMVEDKNRDKIIYIMWFAGSFALFLFMSESEFDQSLSLLIATQFVGVIYLYNTLNKSPYLNVAPEVGILSLFIIFLKPFVLPDLSMNSDFSITIMFIGLFLIINAVALIACSNYARKNNNKYVNVIAQISGYKDVEDEISKEIETYCIYQYKYNDKVYNTLYTFHTEIIPEIGNYVDIKINPDNPEEIYSELHEASKKTPILLIIIAILLIIDGIGMLIFGG